MYKYTNETIEIKINLKNLFFFLSQKRGGIKNRFFYWFYAVKMNIFVRWITVLVN